MSDLVINCYLRGTLFVAIGGIGVIESTTIATITDQLILLDNAMTADESERSTVIDHRLLDTDLICITQSRQLIVVYFETTKLIADYH